MDVIMAATTTKGTEYIIAIVGILGFLLYLRLLRPAPRDAHAPEAAPRKRPAMRLGPPRGRHERETPEAHDSSVGVKLAPDG